MSTSCTHSKGPSLFVKHPIGALHLAGDNQHWRRIKPGTCNASDSVGAAGPGCNHADPEVVGNFGVSLGAHRAGLLMRVADSLDCRRCPQRLVEVHGTAAGYQKHMLHALFDNESNDVVRKLHVWNRRSL
jgi:hypothetical protein